MYVCNKWIKSQLTAAGKAIADGYELQDWKGNHQADFLAKSALKHHDHNPYLQQRHNAQLAIIRATHQHMLGREFGRLLRSPRTPQGARAGQNHPYGREWRSGPI